MQDINDADQAFFRLTIDNTSAWPWAKNETGVLDDDEKREVQQAVKRLMTFWQTRIGQKYYTVEQIEELKRREQVKEKQKKLLKNK